MIDKNDVRIMRGHYPDFSIEFPFIIREVSAVSQVLRAQTDDPTIDLNVEGLNGLGEMLERVVIDLKTMNDFLYSGEEEDQK